MFGCDAVDSVPLSAPSTLRLVKLPTAVMKGCDAVVIVPKMPVADRFPHATRQVARHTDRGRSDTGRRHISRGDIAGKSGVDTRHRSGRLYGARDV
eukprot:50350-Eustigmatos_ZCMA.PRE.1